MRRRLLLCIGLLAIAAAVIDCTPKVRAGSFNIRMFPNRSTDPALVAAAIAQLDADIFGVQEIADADALRDVLARASEATGRDYAFALTRCRNHRFKIATGIVWDAKRWTLDERRDYPDLLPDDGIGCGDWLPSLFGAFSDDNGRRLGVLSVHFPPFTHNYPTRKEHWKRLVKIQQDEAARLDATVLALGDFNSTGFRGEPTEEREYVESLLDEAGHDLLTRDVECTEYYRPQGASAYLPSILDHIGATDGKWSSVSVLGLCERLACEVTDPGDMDPEFATVSDHCPIVVEGRP